MEVSSFGSTGLTLRGVCSFDGCAMLRSRRRVSGVNRKSLYDLVVVASEGEQALRSVYTFSNGIMDGMSQLSNKVDCEGRALW